MLTLKMPAAIEGGVKAARGFVGEAVAVKPGKFNIQPALVARFVSLKPGEETVVAVPVPGLPANADVKSITAILEVADASSLPPSQPTDVTIKRGDEPAVMLQVKQGVPARPRNVIIRLEEGEPIWSFRDTLVNESYDVPDFAAQVNTYLDRMSGSGSQVTLNFLVKSDTPGQVAIAVDRKQVRRLQSQTWTNELDETVRLDRNLELDFGERWEIPLDALQASGSPLTGLRLDVTGTFGAERLLGAIRVHTGRQYATVSADYSIAQQFSLNIAIDAAGISGLLAADNDSELYVELQPDQSGVPAALAPLASANVPILASEDGAASWVYAQFDAPATLKPDTPYWIVAKGVSGAVRLGVEEQAINFLGSLLVNRTGRLWKPFAPGARSAPTAMLCAVYVPGIDNQSAAVQIAVTGADEQAFEPQPASRTLSFAIVRRSLSAAVIEITSHARGVLTIANVIQEY